MLTDLPNDVYIAYGNVKIISAFEGGVDYNQILMEWTSITAIHILTIFVY